MNPTTQTFYRERILAALVHIQSHLDGPLSLADLGAVAHFSPFHFHRLFTALVGESVQEHIRRLRLERAAIQLRYGDHGILQIALDAGFQSHEGFTRAFAAMFGCPPSRYRQSSQDRLFQTVPCGVHYAPHGDLQGFAPQPLGATPMADLEPMHVRIEPLPVQHLAFVRSTGPYAQAAESAWGQLCAWAGPRGLMGPHTRLLGICHDDPEVSPSERIRYDAAITVAASLQAEDPIGLQDLPAGRYAVFCHRGPYHELAGSWTRLVAQWLPGNGHRLGDGPSFEVYLNDPARTAPEDLHTDIHVPLAD